MSGAMLNLGVDPSSNLPEGLAAEPYSQNAGPPQSVGAKTPQIPPSKGSLDARPPETRPWQAPTRVAFSAVDVSKETVKLLDTLKGGANNIVPFARKVLEAPASDGWKKMMLEKAMQVAGGASKFAALLKPLAPLLTKANIALLPIAVVQEVNMWLGSGSGLSVGTFRSRPDPNPVVSQPSTDPKPAQPDPLPKPPNIPVSTLWDPPPPLPPVPVAPPPQAVVTPALWSELRKAVDSSNNSQAQFNKAALALRGKDGQGGVAGEVNKVSAELSKLLPSLRDGASPAEKAQVLGLLGKLDGLKQQAQALVKGTNQNVIDLKQAGTKIESLVDQSFGLWSGVQNSYTQLLGRANQASFDRDRILKPALEQINTVINDIKRALGGPIYVGADGKAFQKREESMLRAEGSTKGTHPLEPDQGVATDPNASTQTPSAGDPSATQEPQTANDGGNKVPPDDPRKKLGGNGKDESEQPADPNPKASESTAPDVQSAKQMVGQKAKLGGKERLSTFAELVKKNAGWISLLVLAGDKITDSSDPADTNNGTQKDYVKFGVVDIHLKQPSLGGQTLAERLRVMATGPKQGEKSVANQLPKNPSKADVVRFRHDALSLMVKHELELLRDMDWNLFMEIDKWGFNLSGADVRPFGFARQLVGKIFTEKEISELENRLNKRLDELAQEQTVPTDVKEFAKYQLANKTLGEFDASLFSGDRSGKVIKRDLFQNAIDHIFAKVQPYVDDASERLPKTAADGGAPALPQQPQIVVLPVPPAAQQVKQKSGTEVPSSKELQSVLQTVVPPNPKQDPVPRGSNTAQALDPKPATEYPSLAQVQALVRDVIVQAGHPSDASARGNSLTAGMFKKTSIADPKMQNKDAYERVQSLAQTIKSFLILYVETNADGTPKTVATGAWDLKDDASKQVFDSIVNVYFNPLVNVVLPQLNSEAEQLRNQPETFIYSTSGAGAVPDTNSIPGR